MIIMTGDLSDHQTRELLARQGTPVVEKPFVTSQLITQIERVLASRADRRAAS
jgi:hypothetical protein